MNLFWKNKLYVYSSANELKDEKEGNEIENKIIEFIKDNSVIALEWRSLNCFNYWNNRISNLKCNTYKLFRDYEIHKIKRNSEK